MTNREKKIGENGSCIFGAIHCAVWNFHFPTVAESVIWKVGNILTTVTPAVLAGTMLRDHVVFRLNYSLALVHWLVRLYSIVKVFFAFRSVPRGIYQIIRSTVDELNTSYVMSCV